MSCEAQKDQADQSAEKVKELAERAKELEKIWHESFDEMEKSCVDTSTPQCRSALDKVTEAFLDFSDAADELEEAIKENVEDVGQVFECLLNAHKGVA